MTWLLRLAWLVCRSVSYYTTLHDWVIKWLQTRWQKWEAFKTHKKWGRWDFLGENPSRLCHSLRMVAPPQINNPGTRIPPAMQAKQTQVISNFPPSFRLLIHVKRNKHVVHFIIFYFKWLIPTPFFGSRLCGQNFNHVDTIPPSYAGYILYHVFYCF